MKYYKLLIRERLARRIRSEYLQQINRSKAAQHGVELGIDTIRKGRRLKGLRQIVKYSAVNGDFISVLYGIKLAIWSSW